MFNIVYDICKINNFEYDKSYLKIISDHIKKAPSHVRLGVQFLLIIDKVIRFFVSLLFTKSRTYTNFILKNKPPLISLLYKLILYILILKINEEEI